MANNLSFGETAYRIPFTIIGYTESGMILHYLNPRHDIPSQFQFAHI
jgi:hypothetical protein